MTWDLSGLNDFNERIARLTQTDVKSTVKAELTAEAEQTLSMYYPTDVVSTTDTSTGFLLMGNGNGLWYREFGTGFIGEGTYPDSTKLPTQTLSFDTYGGRQHWTTQGWVYHYHPITNHLGYWITGGGAHNYGQPAQAGFYQTAMWLRNNAGQIMHNALMGVEE